MDIILVDTSGLTARRPDEIDADLLSGIGAAIAASVATVQRELEAEGILPKRDDSAPAPDAQDEAQPEAEDETQEEEQKEDPAPPMYIPQGKESLNRLLDWLMHQGQAFRLIGVMPEVAPGKRDWFSELLYDIRLRYEIETLMVIEARHVTEDTFHRLFDLGFRSFIIYDDGTIDDYDVQDKIDAVLRFLDVLTTDDEGGRRTLKQSEYLAWGLWLETNRDPRNYRRLRVYMDSGIPWEEIVSPQVSIGGDDPALDIRDLPAQDYLPKHLPCRIYNNSLTIDTSGEILYCPRYCGSEHPQVGNLFRYSPEEVFVHKGAKTLEVGCVSRCANCNYSGRHFWLEDTINVVGEFVALGKTEEGLASFTPVVAPVGAGADINLGAADPETQERELAAFEESLGKWAASMEQWGDEPAQDETKES